MRGDEYFCVCVCVCVCVKERDIQSEKNLLFKLPVAEVLCIMSRYKDYKVDDSITRSKKKARLNALKSALNNDKHCEGSLVIMILIHLPLSKAHDNHNVTLEKEVTHQISCAVTKTIFKYIHNGVSSVPLMKKMISQFTRNELRLGDETQPLPRDRAFYPTKNTIQNHIHSGIVVGKYSHIDQDDIADMIERWQGEDPTELFFCGKCGASAASGVTIRANSVLNMNHEPRVFPSDPEESDDGEDEGSTVERGVTFLYVHQSKSPAEISALMSATAYTYGYL